MIKQLEKHLTSSLPKRLIELVENTVADITPMFLGNTFKDFKRNFDFGLKFTHLVTCDTSADGFSAKIACEINFKKMRSIYPDQKNKTDHQLVDVFSELCNQTLGVINVGLRQIGLQPMISLPICAELSANSAISQVDYMPMIRFVDGQETLAINVSLHVDALCVARWGDLITQASKGDIEFF